MNKKVKTPATSSRVRTAVAASKTKKVTTRTPRTSVGAVKNIRKTGAAGKISTRTVKTTSGTASARRVSAMRKSQPRKVSARPSVKTSQSTRARRASRASSKNLHKVVFYHRISVIARTICLITFSILVFIGVSQVVRGFSLEQVDNKNGIPSSWGLTSANHPDTIDVPITYWDQHRDCKMFEFNTSCNLSNAQKQGGLDQGIVKEYLGADGLPVPAQTDANTSFYPVDRAITGHDPVQATDNFYRWFHEVEGKSFQYDRTLTFTRVGETNEYTYGGRQIFPLDDVETATEKLQGHNFHFTAHMSVPVKINLSGDELFDFSGDDDVWVFLNNRLVLDIGGVHTAIDGQFKINTDGSVTSTVDGKNPVTIDLGLQKGQVVNLDFFYAERNTSEANTRMTIADMEWPISADAKLNSRVVDNKLIEYTASLKNRDPRSVITVNRIAAYLVDQVDTPGFIPLTAQTLSYSVTDDPDNAEWQQLEISAPASSSDGFSLANPVTLAKYGETGDTIYIRYYVAPESNDIDYRNTTSFYTEDPMHESGIAYDSVDNQIAGLSVIVMQDDPTPDPTDPDPTNPTNPTNPDPDDTDDPNNPSDPNSPTNPNDPDNPDVVDDQNGQNGQNNQNEQGDNQNGQNSQPGSNDNNNPSDDNGNNPNNPFDDAPTGEPAIDHSGETGTGNNNAETTPANNSTTPTDNSTAPASMPYSAPAYTDYTDDDDPYSTYLPVLGTVHYVPNTGVVTQLLSTPFNNQTFSGIILSQPFVLANLALFTMSFAIFFPLRRY